MTRSFDTREAGTADSYDLVFEEQGKQGRLTALHPSPLDIFRLWQLFLNNVNPLIKLVHAPTVQQQILDASADLQGVPANTEALMFGVYSMSIASITTGECHAFFGRERGLLLAQYHAGARKALANASLLRSSDLVTLQAFALYLVGNPRVTLQSLRRGPMLTSVCDLNDSALKFPGCFRPTLSLLPDRYSHAYRTANGSRPRRRQPGTSSFRGGNASAALVATLTDRP